MFRVIKEIRPAWVVNENVVGSISNGILDGKIDDLEAEGYSCSPFIIPAEAIGALHKRERVWLVAYDANKKSIRGESRIQNSESKKKGVPKREVQYSQEPVDLRNYTPNADTERFSEQHYASEPGILQEGVSRFFGFGTNPHGNITRDEIKSAIIRSLNGLPEGLDYPWRNLRIAALGNAIVPQVAYEIFRIIDRIAKIS